MNSFRIFIRSVLFAGVTATAVAAQAQVRYHIAMPDMVAAVAGQEVSGSFNAGVVASRPETLQSRITGAWWTTNADVTRAAFAQTISPTQSANTFDAIAPSNALTTATVSPAPEPSTYLLLLAGLGLIGFMARRRQIR